ncbi:MAG TPA: FliH/SctL family protein [Pyrinomonadaceae bacterium]|jgi:type III secretion protein L
MSDNFLPIPDGAQRIVKAKNLKTNSLISGKLLKNQVLKAEQEAHEILHEARTTAAEIINSAEQTAENIRHESYEKGRAESETELIENILAIKAERARNFSNVEQEILRLAVKIAEKIIGEEIKLDETARGEIVLNALKHARQQEMLTVRVNAGDLPLLENMREKIDSFGRAKYIDFVADQAVKSGGCIIESASGTIDARLETQLRILEKALLAQAKES